MPHLFDRAEAFIAEHESGRLDREQLREWLPEILKVQAELEAQYQREVRGLYGRGRPDLARLLAGLGKLLSSAHVLGVVSESGDVRYHAIALKGV